MPGCFPDLNKGTVLYKHFKRTENEDQSTEIVIPPSAEDSNRKKNHNYLYTTSIIIIFIIVSVSSGTLYYSRKVLDSSHDACVPPKSVQKVVIDREITSVDSNTCLENEGSTGTDCRSFVDAIEQNHDGMKYNFVIGQEGELYIGAGYKCLTNKNDNALYVKLLHSSEVSMSTKARLSQIIHHGIQCHKISPNFTIDGDEYVKNQTFTSYQERRHVVYDPGHEKKYIHHDTMLAVCPQFSTKDVEKVETLESFPLGSCSPLQVVNEVIVDIVESPPSSVCSHSPNCLREFEEHHDGFKYNFILSHDLYIYVGSGYKCSTDSAANSTLRIKLLVEKHEIFNLWTSRRLRKYLEILEEGYECGKISPKFSVYVSRTIEDIDYTEIEFVNHNLYDNILSIKLELNELNYYPRFNTVNEIIVGSGNGRHIVERWSRHQFCPRNHSHINITEENKVITRTQVKNITSAPFKPVQRMKVDIEWTRYPCRSNPCPSLLDVIEQDHNGEKYNFVIGPEGELYIGAGFKRLARPDEENNLYVKVLLNDQSRTRSFPGNKLGIVLRYQDTGICSRLAEIVKVGCDCDKILDFSGIEIKVYGQETLLVCSDKDINNEPRKNTSLYFQDPDYESTTLIPRDFKWTFCGNVSSTMEIKKYTDPPEEDKQVPCRPTTDVMYRIELDVVETARVNCSSESDCLRLYDNHYNGTDYNFIIDHDRRLYVGLGYDCEAENARFGTLKVQLLNYENPLQYVRGIEMPRSTALDKEMRRELYSIIEEGLRCYKISLILDLLVEINCKINRQLKNSCQNHYKFDYYEEKNLISDEREYYKITSDHGRGLIPDQFRYRDCETERESYDDYIPY